MSSISRFAKSVTRKLLVAGSVISLTMLATQPALAVAPDAQWCPDAIIFCTTYETLQLAVDAAKANGGPGDINAGPGSFTESVTVNGLKNVDFFGGPSTITGNLAVTNSQNLTFQNFTVQGGNGLTVDHSKGVFYFTGNTASLTITNSKFKNTAGIGLSVLNHNGAISLNKVTSSSNTGSGATLDNRAGSAGVTIVKSKFDKNQGTGLNILSDGFIHLADMSVSKNTSDGATLDNTSGTGSVLIDHTGSGKNKFDKNAGDGLFVRSDAAILVFATTASRNGDFGATLINDTGSSNVYVGFTNTKSKYDRNTQAGLFVQSNGTIYMRGLSASRNLDWGMTVLTDDDIILADMNVSRNGPNGGTILVNYTGSGDVLINTVNSKLNRFDKNGGVSGLGIITSGGIMLTDISASKNVGARGANLNASDSVVIDTNKAKRNHFDGNGQQGLVVASAGVSVTVMNTTASKNGVGGSFDGVQVDTSASNGFATFSCGTYSNNTDNGIQALLGLGQLTLNGIVMSGNTGGNLNSSDLFPTIGICP